MDKEHFQAKRQHNKQELGIPPVQRLQIHESITNHPGFKRHQIGLRQIFLRQRYLQSQKNSGKEQLQNAKARLIHHQFHVRRHLHPPSFHCFPFRHFL